MAKGSLVTRFLSTIENQKKIAQLKKEHAKFILSLKDDELESIFEHLEGPYDSPPAGGKRSSYGSKDLAQKLEDLMRRAPRTLEDLSVWRGSSEQSLVPKKGYPLTTSYEPNNAESYAQGWIHQKEGDRALITQLEVPKGSPNLLLDNDAIVRVFGETPFGDEMEMLLPNPKGGEIETLQELEELIEMIGGRVYGAPETKYITKRNIGKYVPPFSRGGLAYVSS